MTDIFVDISLVLTLTAVVAAIFSWFKQPLILAYLLVGVIAASSGLFADIIQGGALDFFAELGIAFVLFLIGLELRFSDIKQIGRAAVYVGMGQILFTLVFGFLLASTILGLPADDSLILAVALTFSSTIIVVKLLSQKRDMESLYGRIAIGYLIIQDFAAVLTLVLITSIGVGGGFGEFLATFVKGILLIGIILVLNRFVLQKLFDLFAKNTEILFLTVISWALIFSTLSAYLGFSIEVGAFLAGLGLANLREQQQIASWIRPIRNLFVILFFLSLGLNLTFAALVPLLGLVIVLSLFVLVGNPLIMMIIMGFLGFRSRTSFQVAVTSAQVSEFSLIVVFLAGRLGIVSESIVNLTVAIALTTIVLSSYLIINSSKIYLWFGPYLKIFQRKVLTEKPFLQDREFSDHVVIVGAGRLGSRLIEGLRKKGNEVLVVDFDPDIVKKLEAESIPVIYGDISDPEIFEKAAGKNPKIIISTVYDHEDTHSILSSARQIHHKFPVVVTSAAPTQALEFYKKGASYVIVPRLLSSQLIEGFLVSTKFNDLRDGVLRKNHIEELGKNLAV